MSLALFKNRLVRHVFSALLLGAALGLLVAAAQYEPVTEANTTLAIPIASITEPTETPVPVPEVSAYIEVESSCNIQYGGGACVYARAAPSTSAPIASKLRTGMVLAVGDILVRNNELWYRIVFDEWVRYPERTNGTWYVRASDVRMFVDLGKLVQDDTTHPDGKLILVDRSSQMLYAYDGDALFMKTRISTGLELTPTPRGVFTVYRKTPTRYMQGPLPGVSSQYYDLPGVPWDLYFTAEGGAIHGAYWHDNFGRPWSHGCVNVPLEDAETLYHWANVGTAVWVRD